MRFINERKDIQKSTEDLQVLGTGLSRCATSSLQAALETLGYAPTMHMAEVAPSAEREQLVIDAMRENDTARRQKLLHQIFDGYAATTDFPGWCFTDDLMDMYPDAKLVLNTRTSAAAWSKSINEALRFFGSNAYYYTCIWWKTDRLHWQIHQTGYLKIAKNLNISPEDCFTEKHFNAHNEWVRREAKKRGRPVLEHRAEDGWEPLCKFLHKEIPSADVRYPWLNEAAAVKGLKIFLVARGLAAWAVMIGLTYGAWYSSWRLL